MIIPSLDIFNKKIVRLFQGNYKKKKIYKKDVFKELEKCRLAGVKYVHLVDLEGAKNPKNKQVEFLKSILNKVKINIQVGGGIRSEKDIEDYFSYGAKRIVLGSSVIEDEKNVKNWLLKYGSELIVLALDIKISDKKEVFINGWTKKTDFVLEDLLKKYEDFGLKHVLCTDISKDGTLKGSNINLYKELCLSFKHLCFQSSGGVSSLIDILNLKKNGISEIIIGKSFLEEKFSILEAIKCWRKG
ncbi:1-(5-phosphoribosyl)-5-[(5-phosphoribosylamino)methylideneamino] imidazole-4-carboxamide isomerase [Buchnera aphidicola (Tetraneura ulmi)]|uniref:1-(5-phosphoribosyl)-5-[(5- phosphoribosylamino)methylideneamino]imidazole-4- carboxamide isomerase n=1 Tax=Buchnera aphidicola TaxID=9 RepID=UPI00346392CE